MSSQSASATSWSAPTRVPSTVGSLKLIDRPGARYRSRIAAALRSGVAALRAHYATRTARIGLLALSFALSYGGGAAMFWLHAIYRGEQGPPIANQWHWMLDSSLGFLALTPVLAVVVPLVHRLGGERPRAIQSAMVGGLFALVTTPGPILHDRVAGGGTPLARLAASSFGVDPHVVVAHLHAVEHSAVSECLLQLAVGLPVYMLLAHLVALAVRRLDNRPETAAGIDLVREPNRGASVLVRAA